MQNLSIKKLKAVVFDWDNTLVNSQPVMDLALNKTLEKFGLPDWQTTRQKFDPSLSFQDNFPNLFGSGATEAFEDYKKFYAFAVEGLLTKTYYAAELIDYFYQKHVPVTIMTNKNRALFDLDFPLVFDQEDVSRAVCGHEAAADKPNPAHVYKTIEGLIDTPDINPDTLWIIGDDVLDVLSAQNTGARAIRVANGKLSAPSQDQDVLEVPDLYTFYQMLPPLDIMDRGGF